MSTAQAVRYDVLRRENTRLQAEIETLRAERDDLRRTTASLRDGTTLLVPRKLLTEAHACMRACGWQLAPASEDGTDGVLALAVAEVEQAVGAMVAGTKAADA